MKKNPPAISTAPVKRMKIVQMEYWDCGINTHNHQTEAIAAACIAKRLQRAEYKACTNDDLDRLRQSIQIGKRIIKGETFFEIAKEMDRSANRVRQVFCRLMRQAASGSVSGKTILPPAKHLAYGHGVRVVAIRRDAAVWLERLAEIETALAQHLSVPK